jgi:hypothetical protein
MILRAMQKNRGCKGHGDGSWLSDCNYNKEEKDKITIKL